MDVVGAKIFGFGDVADFAPVPSDRRGICLISIPKSGTMFLSRYLETQAAAPVVFGLQAHSAPALTATLAGGPHPKIAAVRRVGGASPEAMARRFALMLARNRAALADSGRMILSDHGYHSFLKFLIAPEASDIIPPAQVVERARALGLAPVFLHRNLAEVANSLLLFLTSGKSFLLDLEGAEAVAELVAELYVPVLARQIAHWRAAAADLGVLVVDYAQLMQDPAASLAAVCRHGGLPLPDAEAATAPAAYRSWTWRGDRALGWRDTFAPHLQARLTDWQAQADAGVLA